MLLRRLTSFRLLVLFGQLGATSWAVIAMFAAYLFVYGVAGTQGALGNVLETAIVLAVFTIPISIGIAT